MKDSIKHAYSKGGTLQAVQDEAVRRQLLPRGQKLMGGLQADHEPSLPLGSSLGWQRMLLTPKASFVLAQPMGSSLPASSAATIASDGAFLVECPEDRYLHAKMDKMSEMELGIFVAEQLERGGFSARQSLARHTKKRAGRRKGSTNKPRTGQNKTKAASSGGTSTKRRRGRPKGSLNKPKHGQAAAKNPKARVGTGSINNEYLAGRDCDSHAGSECQAMCMPWVTAAARANHGQLGCHTTGSPSGA
eukprot:363605-Chlamydomonas_euryale.AAC.2